MSPKYSLVIPVYGNASNVKSLFHRLTEIDQRLNSDLEVLFVIDGSPDNSLQLIVEELVNVSFSAKVIEHSRNFGSFAAIKTGFINASGKYTAAMAADLQEPVELIYQFFELLEKQDYDVAVGVRKSRHDPGISSQLSNSYWGLYKKFIEPQMPSGGVDIFALNKEVAKQLVALPESHSSLVGLLFWVGYKRAEVPYDRLERVEGKSAWSFKKKLKYLMDSVFSFTSLPISLILTIGLLGIAVTFVVALFVLVSWLTGNISVPGYAAQMIVQLLTGGSLLFAIGVVGTYVWRTYENTKNRPYALIMSIRDFNSKN